MACGKAHTVVYTRSGKLFAFGSNAEGQLGVGRAPEYSDIPMELSSAKEVIREEVAKLAAGSVHSLALGRKTGESPTAFNARDHFPLLLQVKSTSGEATPTDSWGLVQTRRR